jgi:hypothetical protein
VSVLVLPTRADAPYYDFEIELEQRSFLFTFRWNARDDAWIFDLATGDGEAILSGRKVTLGMPLLARFRDARLPAGDLLALDTTGQDVEPGLEELGGRVVLLYVEAGDLPAGFLAP